MGNMDSLMDRPKPWEKGMNPEQQAIIAHTDGPLFCPAQAGSGKTRALVNRIARMVNDGVDPKRILAVTFSKNAAEEMNKRLSEELGVTRARVGTWHSLAYQIIREDEMPQKSWDIDDKNRHKIAVKTAMGYKYEDWKRGDATKTCGYIGYCKANLWMPESEEALRFANALFGFDAMKAVKVYTTSDELVHEKGLLTFDDMLVFVTQHFAKDGNGERWAARWDYVLQDETQDTNVAQMVIAEALARRHRNYMVVGDPAQAIYGFRGSDPKHLMEFREKWDAKYIFMNRNYRSAKSIIHVANEVIRRAKVRLEVDMIPMRAEEGRVRVAPANNLDDEAEQFVSWARGHKIDRNGKYSDCVCLFRTNAQSRALEEALLKEHIPYVVVGGVSFYERREVKDLLAYLRVAGERDDAGDGVRRCINSPFRFLGAKFVEKVMDIAKSSMSTNWLAIVREASQLARIQRRQEDSAMDWCAMIEYAQRAIKQGKPPAEILDYIIDKTGYIAWIKKDQGDESIEQSAAANVRELVRVAAKFKSVNELLDYINQSIDESKKQRSKKGGDRVLLMSIHRSKGLEWPFVWVVGCNDKILPHGNGDPEEERRLFYVATTRAMDGVTFSWVRKMATKYGVKDYYPSPYLEDAGLIEYHDEDEDEDDEDEVEDEDEEEDDYRY